MRKWLIALALVVLGVTLFFIAQTWPASDTPGPITEVPVGASPDVESPSGPAPDTPAKPAPADPVLAPDPSPPPPPIVVGRPVGPVDPAPPSPSPRPPPPRKWNINEHFDEVDAALSQLVTGNVAFSPPSKMAFRESRTIALLVSPKLSAEGLSDALRQRVGGDQPIVVEALAIAPVMEAKLEGKPALDVTALTPERQAVGGNSPTEWRWMVRADEEGKHALHLSMNAVVKVGNEQYPRSLRVFDREIEVDITLTQRMTRFAGDNWQWGLGTIGIPLGLWWRRRRTREKDPMAPMTGKK